MFFFKKSDFKKCLYIRGFFPLTYHSSIYFNFVIRFLKIFELLYHLYLKGLIIDKYWVQVLRQVNTQYNFWIC